MPLTTPTCVSSCCDALAIPRCASSTALATLEEIDGSADPRPSPDSASAPSATSGVVAGSTMANASIDTTTAIVPASADARSPTLTAR